VTSDAPQGAVPLDPRAAQTLPIPKEVIEAHRAMLRARGPHRNKDRVLDRDEPDHAFDVKVVEAAIASGALSTRAATWPTSYAQLWGIELAGGEVKQSPETGLDLIWAASMPDDRAATPVLVIEYAEGLSLFDGAHRLVRAYLDGSAAHPCLIFKRDDALGCRIPADP